MGWRKALAFCECRQFPAAMIIKCLFASCGQVSGGWWDTIKVIWRYGIMAPKKTQAMQVLLLIYLSSPLNQYLLRDSVDDMIKQFVTLYSPETAKWDDISDLASSFGWTGMVSQTTLEYLKTHGVSQKYAYELVEGATRVNYGQVRFAYSLIMKCNSTNSMSRTSIRSTR